MHRDLVFRTPVVLVPGTSLETKLRVAAGEGRGLPTRFDEILRDLTQRGPVPAIVDDPMPGKKDHSLVLYAYRYTVRLFPTPRLDAYRVVSVTPLRLRDHETLTRACLLLRARWTMAAELRQIPPGSTANWPDVGKTWAALHRDLGDRLRAPVVSPAHDRFLATLDRLIDETHEFESRRAQDRVRFPYRAYEPAAERRFSAAPFYAFRLAGDARPERGKFVRIHGEDRQRGEVVRVEGDKVTVRFDDHFDQARLPAQGELEETHNEVVYAKRREAVGVLRARRSANPNLLPAFVDRRFLPLRPRPDMPREALDPSQIAAFQAALGVQDLMVVLGPPGTGKTRTISQIASAHTASPGGGQVLVASHTNRAVDNVLARLAVDLVVVRVGNEGQVGPEGRPFLLDQQASELRSVVLGETKLALDHYDGLPAVAEWTTELGRRIAQLHAILSEEDAARSALLSARKAFGGVAQTRLEGAEKAYTRLQARMHGERKRADRLAAKHTRLTSRPRQPWPPAWTAFLERRRANRLTVLGERLTARAAEVGRAWAGISEAAAELDRVTCEIPEVRLAAQRLAPVEERRRTLLADAMTAVSALQAALGELAVVPPLPATTSAHETAAALDDVCAWSAAHMRTLAARARLLADWRAAVGGDTAAQLHPELLQYAHVIGATCIGSASRTEISERTFDLAIVDEAGQIGTADLLVPLVRAQRAVLVGDHRQLPPFLDQEVENWATRLGDPELGRLVRSSALENLVEMMPPTHVRQLTEQRRMPLVIAEWISEAFYGGILRTDVRRPHTDALFTSPFAFVDTSDLPARHRYERDASTWNRRRSGWLNHAEARLLTALATHYRDGNAEWAILVPYAAQRDLIRELLTRELPDLEQVDGLVGTVDAFQGGEREVILYGFTRSNEDGRVGFLEELRRANVAFTRAKSQLVLVGDLGMLTRARDPRFRELARSLHAHLRGHGDIRGYHEVRESMRQPGKD